MQQQPNDELRFGFGDNWMAFVPSIDEDRIIEAEKSLQALLTVSRLDGKSFLDIGSGSGLFSLAARRLGARVHSFDFDLASVASTEKLRDRYFPEDANWIVEQGSVLDPGYLTKLGHFDIVYSWGVLHHTGAMFDALDAAAARTAPGGLFAFALYRKTKLCWAWTLEKRWYTAASTKAQATARGVYTAVLRLAFLVNGRDFNAHIENYQRQRGMSFPHDVHDWMGGYPYESITPAGVGEYMRRLKFAQVNSITKPTPFGFFGSGCDEYAYRRTQGE